MKTEKVRTPYIATKYSSFDHLRNMKNVELTEWFNKHAHFYDKIKNGKNESYVLKMVSKLMYANLLRKKIINLA